MSDPPPEDLAIEIARLAFKNLLLESRVGRLERSVRKLKSAIVAASIGVGFLSVAAALLLARLFWHLKP